MSKYIWNITIDDYIEAYELAKSRGKKAGDSLEVEFLEIMKKKGKKPLGKTDKYADVDMLTGELRDKGLRVLNLKEEERRKDNEI